MLKIFKKEYVSYVFVLLAGLLMSGIAAYATTSIGLGIATGGSFYATGTVNVAGAILASSTIATSGNITVPAAYALDTAGGGALNIGTTTATSITIGSVTANTTFGGNLIEG